MGKKILRIDIALTDDEAAKLEELYEDDPMEFCDAVECLLMEDPSIIRSTLVEENKDNG